MKKLKNFYATMRYLSMKQFNTLIISRQIKFIQENSEGIQSIRYLENTQFF